MSTPAAEEVRFDSDGLALEGTFATTEAPIAAVLLIAGSGETDRDSNTPKLRLGVTAALARALQDANVASLRFDKRGVGASRGARGGMAENLADARAALAWLESRTASLPLFVVGHSEGALHAAELAADGLLAGAVLLSMSARGGEEILLWQAATVTATLPAVVRVLFRATPERLASTQRKKFARIRASSTDFMRIQGQRVNARWLRQYLDYDPTPTLARIAIPVLAITGGHDLQVPPDDVEIVERLVKGPCDARKLDDLSHILRPDPGSKGPRAYRRAVREPVSPQLLEVVTDWITKRSSDTTAPR